MTPPDHDERVPKALRDRYHEITTLTDEFCSQYLTDEYRTFAVASLPPCAAKDRLRS
ncbi:hypothetical protein [Paraburkholderia xenovorans]